MLSAEKKENGAKLVLLLTSLIWGFGFIFSQVALDAGLTPSVLMLGKFGIAAVVFGLVNMGHIIRNFKPKILRSAIPVGIILAASFFAQTLGLQYSSPSNCALITAAYVVLTPFLWWMVNKKRPRPIVFVASLICLAGVAVLSVSFEGEFRIGRGDLFTIGAAVLFAIQIVATESAVGGSDYRVFLFAEFFTAAVFTLAVTIITGFDLTGLRDPRGVGSVLFLGLFSTCLCYFFQTSSQRYVQASVAAIILSLESLFGAILSVIIGYDPLSAKLVIGAALMFTSVILPDIGNILNTKQIGGNNENNEKEP